MSVRTLQVRIAMHKFTGRGEYKSDTHQLYTAEQ